MKIWETPLPSGYSQEALFLRRWLLDLRLRVEAIPHERALMLERKINEFHRHGKRGIVPAARNGLPGSRSGTSQMLARAVSK